MLKKILDVIRKNFIIIICIVIFVLFCIFIKDNYMDIVNKIDENISTFFSTKMISNNNTEFMKGMTYFGDYVLIGIIFILCLIVFKSKIVSIMMTLNILLIGASSVLLKAFFRRPRPDNALINMPITYSFPSGHTMFATAFYGFIIYFIWKTNCNVFIKYVLTFIISMVIIFVGISRIYLGVHYFSDVIGGFVLGVLLLILSINTYLNFDWRWKK